MAVNYFRRKACVIKRNYFKNCNLGSGKLPRYVQDDCSAIGVIDEGVRDQFTAHGLRPTAVTLLLHAGNKDQSVAKIIVHQNSKSVLAYAITDGVLSEADAVLNVWRRLGRMLREEIFSRLCAR